MATAPRRAIKISKSLNRVRKSRGDTAHMLSAGGVHDTIGYTADFAGSTDMQTVRKNIYGIFEDTGPHYQVIYGDIAQTNEVRVIEPVYAYADLLRVYLSSTVLRQCIDSYVTNIESYGTELEYIGPEGEESSRAAMNEKARIERLMQTLTTDGRPISKHREDSRVDKEVLGARCFEVIQDALGRVVHFDHIETASIRMTSREKDFTDTAVTDYKTGATRRMKRRFRRFLQIGPMGEKVWFKEFGDTRKISATTGKVDNTLAIEDEATSIYYERMYSPGTPCGIPRWAGAIPSLLGAREAEMVNLNFFRDNAIPAMAILVSGGALTEESFDKIDSYITGIRGQASMNRIVVMEAVAEGAEAAAIDGSLPAPKIDIKPMMSERQHEGLFKDYIAESERKSRSTFRLPPIYIGSAQEYNRASAFASMLTADQQIFVPERLAWDEMFETVVLSTHGLKYWRVRSRGPGMQDPQEVARIVNSLGREGALTPNIAIKLANRYLDADIRPVIDEWGDLPYSSIMQMMKTGHMVKGFDVHQEVLSDVLPDEDEQQTDTSEPLTVTSKMLRGLLDEVSDTLEQRLEDAMQSIAAETD